MPTTAEQSVDRAPTAEQSPAEHGATPTSGTLGLALRAWGLAAVPVACALAVVVVAGAHREGRLLDVVLGVVLVAVAALCGAWLKARAVHRPTDDPMAGSALQIAIAGDFVLMLVLFALGAGALVLARGGKFTGLEEFGLSFAGAGLIFLVVSAATIARAAQRRPATTTRTGTV